MEISADQNMVIVKGNELVFCPVDNPDWRCIECDLYLKSYIDYCIAPCSADRRKDNKNGVFLIQGMPQK